MLAETWHFFEIDNENNLALPVEENPALWRESVALIDEFR